MSLLSSHVLESRVLSWSSRSRLYPFFDPPPHSAPWSSILPTLTSWFHVVEKAADECRISAAQRADVALQLLRGDLKEVMAHRREVYLTETQKPHWDWADFKEDLKRIVEGATKLASDPSSFTAAGADALTTLCTSHPFIASSISLGLIIGGTAILLPALGRLAWRSRLATRDPQLSFS